jgi:Flavin-binding monooxygenase-like
MIEFPEIAEFIIKDRSVRFSNNHVETHVDAIVFCTGYLFSFPFLQSLSPPITSSSPPISNASPDPDPQATVTGTYVPHLYQHIFYIPRPTLSFLALPYRIVTFPFSESQASVVARFLSRRLSLPSEEEMTAWETNLARRQASENGGSNNIHVLGYPADAEYINYLASWAALAVEKPGLENKGKGKLPWFWDEETCWLREMTSRIKEAARSLGPVRRRAVMTWKELGFKYPGTKKGDEMNE